VIVQAPPAPITLDRRVDFGAASPATGLFASPISGSWQSTADGRFVAVASSTATPAVNLIGVSVSPGSLLEITTVLRTSAQGGVVFDYHGPNVYKFATLSADGRQVLIGHRTAAGTVIDASFATNVSSNTDYTLKVSLRGSLVNVSLNGAVVASKLYNATITVGGYGLISLRGASSGQTSFDSVQVKTDDAAYAAPPQLLAAQAPTQALDGSAAPSGSELAALSAEAQRRWASMGVSDAALQWLRTVEVKVADLPGLVLGEVRGDTILIDRDAAGHGWFIDATPGADNEFAGRGARGDAAGRIDLLTVLHHEFGHVLGRSHGSGAMAETLDVGQREVPRVMAPSIDWRHAPGAGALPAARPVKDLAWLHRFVNDLGVPSERLNPNAGFRVFLPVVPRSTSL
jgi:hypothetical protein